ncbi:septum formation initiator family protein [Flaviaesturariibacter flavus]|uniref:Septum formation initiator family protein n=1 Tax=Flaviaesturariibacter flavus TaxID=2502780 RepID=A0A4R1BMR0_9BACT|nr:septum formation initiator family protein [Flaviaesturariibacter flavus]TCJ18753.1 septum formation initiator family protein [Flaviaesturariibacter flavus]
MKAIRRIPPFLRNKFFIAGVGFLVWLLFFDRNDFFIQRERRAELRALQASKKHYQQQIDQERKFADNLRNDPATIERFARERYGMKRENEDLFLVPGAKNSEPSAQ